MKNIIILILFLWVILACTSKDRKETETYENGSPKVEQYFENDTLVKEITYYENNLKRYEGEYKNGQRHGHWIYWYSNGNVWSEGYFYMGENDSIRTVYHENGNKYYSGKYRKGTRVGIWKFWDVNGNFVKQVDYGND